MQFFCPMIPPTSEWKTIPGFGEKYQVTKTGRIRNSKTGRELSPYKKPDGYLAVNLSHQNKAKPTMVHRLVAEAYIPNPEGLPVVNHIDGDKGNPHVKNLEWVSFSENSLHAFRTGLSQISEKCKNAVSKIAAENGAKTTSKPVFQINANGKRIHRYKSVREAERTTGIPRGNIIRACKIQGYTAGGFKWEKE